MEVLVEDCHENSCQGSFENQFDNLQRELLFEQPSHGKQMTEFFEGCHVFMIQWQSTWRGWEMVMDGYISIVKINFFILTLCH